MSVVGLNITRGGSGISAIDGPLTCFPAVVLIRVGTFSVSILRACNRLRLTLTIKFMAQIGQMSWANFLTSA